MIKQVCSACSKEIILVCGDFVQSFPPGWDTKSFRVVFGENDYDSIHYSLCPDCLAIKDIIE
jgi:predicted phosphodiesterase